MHFGDILRNETLSYSQIFLRSYEVCLAEVLCMHVMVCIYLITAKISKFYLPSHLLKWNTFFFPPVSLVKCFSRLLPFNPQRYNISFVKIGKML